MPDRVATQRHLAVGGRRYAFHSLPAFAEATGAPLARLPVCLRVLLENLLRHEDGEAVTAADILALAMSGQAAAREVSFHPARVLMPDSSGIPLLVDLAAMRDAVAARGFDPRRVNPLIPADLIIDHSVAVDHAGSADAMVRNMAIELERNRERYGLARWAETQFDNLRVIPPGNGILHQINVEHLASVVATAERDGETWAFPDTLVGMDSHTPMVNGLGVLGWGVGGIEAMTALLGQPVGLLVPRVIGCRLTGAPRPGVLGADIALTLTERLRPAGLLGAVVEFFGPGLDALTLPNRATIANMAPEYGATMGFFPIDAMTLGFLRLTGRPEWRVDLVEAYARAQGLFRSDGDAEGQAPDYDAVVEFDLSAAVPCMAGPSRPEAWLPLSGIPGSFRPLLEGRPAAVPEAVLRDGDVVIASITSCTNTSNPQQMLAAGLLARNAVARGLRRRDWVKTSLSPGSRVVTGMLERAGLLAPLAELGFDVTGYGCMSCGGNAGPLDPAVSAAVAADALVVAGVLSSNRNFEGRLHPAVRGTYLGAPPLVVAYAIAGSVLCDLDRDPLGLDGDGRPVHLRDIWPQPAEIDAAMAAFAAPLFQDCYGALADGGAGWRALPAGTRPGFDWDPASEYLKRPPFLDEDNTVADLCGARILLLLGDDVTTDHISPGGAIAPASPAGRYLTEHGVAPAAFSSYIARRANHEVMVRGTFANARLRNLMVAGQEGGVTRRMPGGAVTSVYEAAMAYRRDGVPLVVVAGRNYGNGSSRDWAAKGTRLLGIRAVIAESFERIHRSNLVGMGVLPLQFPAGTTRATLALDGSETIDLPDLTTGLAPGMTVVALIRRADGTTLTVPLRCRVDTGREVEWMRQGGILPYVLRALTAPRET